MSEFSTDTHGGNSFSDAHKPRSEVYSAWRDARAKSKAGTLSEPGGSNEPLEVSPRDQERQGPDRKAGLQPGSESACPTCGRKPSVKREPSKLRGSKTIKLPKEAAEDGVEVLETLIAECEKELRPDERPRSPYFTLCEVLAFFLTAPKERVA